MPHLEPWQSADSRFGGARRPGRRAHRKGCQQGLQPKDLIGRNGRLAGRGQVGVRNRGAFLDEAGQGQARFARSRVAAALEHDGLGGVQDLEKGEGGRMPSGYHDGDGCNAWWRRTAENGQE